MILKMYRANSERTGFYETTGVRRFKGIKWKFRQSNAVRGWTPSWNCGIASDNGIVCISNSGGNLYGLTSQTGKEIWTHKLKKCNDFVYPVVAKNTIYLSYRQMDYKTVDEYLLAIDLYSGQKKWEFKFPLNLKTFTFDFALTYSSPAVSNDVIFVGSGNGYLYAINALSGEVIWSFKTTKNKPLTTPAVGKDIVAVYSRDGYLYAIDIF
ncbi:MAG: PQQ-binding-like beta-propeller repeat protein, partial [Cyanobacteria bacterium P01_C01_bin.72]